MWIRKGPPLCLPEGYPLIKVADHCYYLESVLLVLETYDWPNPFCLVNYQQLKRNHKLKLLARKTCAIVSPKSAHKRNLI